jgi:predicted dehydrogenase
VGVGIVGLGVISRFYLAAIERVPGLALAGVCDVSEKALAPHRDSVACYRDYRALLADPAVGAVVVTVPNDRHVEVCRAALDAGRPVCVEKPLAIGVADAEKLRGHADERGLVLCTAFHRRHNAEIAALRARLACGAPVRAVRVWYQERIEDHLGTDAWYLEPARCGGGCVADNGPNAFDVARTIAGSLRVTGARIDWDTTGTDRQAHVALTGDEDVPVLVELDWSYPGERKQVEVTLADGTVERADMLRGHPEFKGSLWHEYVGVLTDFAARLAGAAVFDGGVDSVRLIQDVYEVAM